ncbi:chitinase [Streptomyces sp. NPDC058297]|uniref:chitinase n=1 Tax=Streptomyces sp. NPDC058297 TaxID=3346433 RepID=UPI0036E154D7
MRNLLGRPAAAIVSLVAAATCAGCSSGSSVSDSADASPHGAPSPAATAPSSSSPFAPYVSATTASDLDVAGTPSAYNLAFAIADGSSCTPTWNGTHAIGDAKMKKRISALKASRATLRVSFGGASGKELAETCGSASALADAYAATLDAAGATEADFDIEGDALKDSDSVTLRSEAIALLQKKRTDLKVSFTLPVMPSGLDADSVALLESANDQGVKVSSVNIMTMNYGTSYTGDMGDYAITSAKAAHAQLADIFGLSDRNAWRGLAVTPMLGTNDIDNETFTLSDAAQLRAFAEKEGLAWVSMWSTFRDQECSSADTSSDDALTNCSGVQQSSGAFGKALAG